MRALCWALLAAGCAPKAAPPQVVLVPQAEPATPPEAPLVGVLQSVGMLLVMPPERQVEEIDSLQAGLDSGAPASDRVRLALLLAVGAPEVRDSERVHALLDDRTWDDAAYEALARFVLQLADERAGRARDRLDAAEALEAERKLRKELEARLDAIRTIETDIERRDLADEEPHDQRAPPPPDPVR
ncbi:MAG: hypothetical protein R3F59_33165 [Myxococcota bacterium]